MIQEMETKLKSLKTELARFTKDFRVQNPGDIPHEGGIKLLQFYKAQYQKMVSLEHSFEANLNNAFSKLILLEDPSDFLNNFSNSLSDLTEFDTQIQDLKNEIQNEKAKNEEAKKLKKQLEMLKLDSESQIAVASQAAQVHAAADLEIHLTQLQDDLRRASDELRNIEQTHIKLQEQLSHVENDLSAKENEFDLASNLRQEQLNSLSNELREAELTFSSLKDTQSINSVSESQQKIITLKNQADDELNQMNLNQRKIQEINEQIKLEKDKLQKQFHENDIKINSLQAQIKSKQDLLDKLPTPIEWARLQQDVNEIKNLQDKYIIVLDNFNLVQKDFLALQKDDEKLQSELLIVEEQTVSSKQKIEQITEKATGVVEVLKKQRDLISLEISQKTREIYEIEEELNIRRKDLAALNEEISQIRRETRKKSPQVFQMPRFVDFNQDFDDSPFKRFLLKYNLNPQKLAFFAVIYLIFIHILIIFFYFV